MAVTFNPFTGNLDFVGSGGGSTSPGGSDTQVQFNDDGDFGGDAGLVFNKSTNKLTAGGDIELNDGGANTLTLQTVTPTAARTISFPDATGTVGLVAGSSGQLIINDSGAYAGLSTGTVSSGNVTLSGLTTLSGSPSANNTSGVLVSGTWRAGASSNNPQLLVNPSGTTLATNWNATATTGGTGLGINAPSGFTGDLVHYLTNNTSRYRVTGLGRVFIGEGATTGPALTVTAPGRLYSGTATYTDNTTAASGTAAHGAMVAIDNPAIAASNATVTYTNASSFYIDGAPTNGTNVTITNSYSFFVNAGASYFGGNLQLAAGSNIVAATTGSGTQIGTGATQLLGFYGATAVDQPAAVADATDGTDVITRLNDLLARIRELGLIAT
jgi:hypothetical protein